MYKFLLRILFVISLATVSFSQESNQPTSDFDNSSQKTFSESRPYHVRGAKSRKIKKNSSKKTNPKKEAKRKLREKKRREKANRKFEKVKKKDDAKFNAKNSKWLSSEKVVTIEENRVSIPVTIYNKDGAQILDIGKDEFKVFENGIEQEILRVGKTTESNTIILLFDISPSTKFLFKETQTALKNFIEKINPKDRLMIVGFDQKRYVISEPTNNKANLVKAVKKMKYGSGTSIYEAVSLLSSSWIHRIGGRKTILVFSDGVDTTSLSSDYMRSIQNVMRSNITVSTIYYNSYKDYNPVTKITNTRGKTLTNEVLRKLLGNAILGHLRRSGGAAGTSVESYKTGKRYLWEISFVSGGRVFNIDTSKDQLSRAFNEALKAIQTQTLIEYVSNQKMPVIGGRKIKVRINRPNLTVHIRDTYFSR